MPRTPAAVLGLVLSVPVVGHRGKADLVVRSGQQTAVVVALER